MAELMDARRCPLCCKQYHLNGTPAESKALNDRAEPLVIVAGSGMVTGGRILHHLRRRLPDPRTTVLLVGYQAEATRGRALQEGAEAVTIFGERVPVRARVETSTGCPGTPTGTTCWPGWVGSRGLRGRSTWSTGSPVRRGAWPRRCGPGSAGTPGSRRTGRRCRSREEPWRAGAGGGAVRHDTRPERRRGADPNGDIDR